MVTRPKAISPDQKARIGKAPTTKTAARKRGTAHNDSSRLDEYRAKRRFGVTPEPAPQEESSQAAGRREKKTASKLAFVVQKHDARRLHYDVRLEIDGAMASWAVPKGPSFDPVVRRLAVQTEDHPMEYNAFEGRIPDREYGAGDVLIWDRGTYETVPPGEQHAMLEKGHLHVRFFGEKLVGDWHFIRTSGRGGSGRLDDGAGGSGKAQWLFFKAKDAHANPSYDVVTERPESVVSGRKATRGPLRVGASEKGKSAKALLDTAGEPMLATAVPSIALPAQFSFEAKYDGYRILAGKAGADVRLRTRHSHDWTDRFVPIAEGVAKLVARECVIDGEACVVDEAGRPSFSALQEWLGGGTPHALIAYVAFDLLWLDGRDLRSEPIEARRELLEKLVEGRGPPISFSRTVVGELDALLEGAKKMGLEGLVAKKKGSTYSAGRSTQWLKLRFDKRQDCAIAGWIPLAGTTSDVGALLLAVAENDKLVFAGSVGTGFDNRTRKSLAASLAPDAVDAPRVDGVPKGGRMRGARWVKPRLCCDVAFTEWTREGSMRHPRYMGLREDKTPLECVREGTTVGRDPGPAPSASAKPASTKAAKHPAASAREPHSRPGGPKLANPAKVLFPRDGITKRDIWDYVTAIAPVMLPHLSGRPLTLQRYPDGIDGQEWYQQNAPEKAPDFVRLVDVGPRHENKKRIACDDLDTLQWLANLAALTLHQWCAHVPASATSRAAIDQAIAQPDYVVLDLDPGDGPWSHLIEVAGAVHVLLEKLELESFVKTSGKRGLHVLVPIAPGPTHDQATGFAEQVARAVAKVLPKVATVERMKDKRGGKLYVDYGQNGEGRTVVAPYTIRARDGAVVSTPITWDEVHEGLDPTRFTIRTVLERVDKHGDLFEGVLSRRQALPALAGGSRGR
jgi:bifunctional non-homologous end joining protein LigD